jgi:dienelactone hydrolase
MDSAAEPKPGRFRRFRQWLARLWGGLLPGVRTRRGATTGILAAAVVCAVFFGIFMRPGLPGLLDPLAGVVFYLVMAVLMGLLLWLAYRLLLLLPRFLSTLGLVAFVVLVYSLADMGVDSPLNILIGIVLATAAAFLGGGLVRVFSPEFRFFRPMKKGFVILCVVGPMVLFCALVIWMTGRGSTEHLAEPPVSGNLPVALSAPNPARPGPYPVLSMTYGSEKNPRRPEFGVEAVLKTESVDATPFVKNNKGWKVKLRHWYWGFDFKEFPVNGTVWYPEGDGPFPLVLIVHGNHKMQEYSDPGYAYLGELLASRGFILVSVDENFFNGAFMGGLSSENDGRGWMLLQHLKVWRAWNQDRGNPFFGKIDMDNIGLIGHSRGGEAAAIAGAFNRLRFYPDDATVTFDFDFNIKAIIAIAPSDQQYRPTGRPTPLENVNYFTIQGAHDSDVSIFVGERQYNRVRFTDGEYRFKATLYSYRSNHGQFNTVWGDSDWGRPMGFILNRKALLSGEEQRTLGKVYMSAFLEATLHGRPDYLPMFWDHRVIADWLPQDIYLSRFEDSTFQTLCDFEEDVDVTTGTLKGSTIDQKGLAVWWEADLKTRSRSTKQDNVVFVGWRGPAEERQGEAAPYYTIHLPENPSEDLQLSRDSVLMFSLTEADEKVPDLEEEEELEEDSDEAEGQDENASLEGLDEKTEITKSEKEEDQAKQPLELSIELVDGTGVSVRLPLERFMPVPPVTKSRFLRTGKESGRMGKAYEPTLQTYQLSLQSFMDANPDFDPQQLRSLRFVFDRGREGVLVLDRIGIARKGPAPDLNR